MKTELPVKVPEAMSHRRRYGYRYAGFFCIALSAFVPDVAQAQANPATLPPVQVDAPKDRQPQRRTAATAKPSTRRRTAARSNQAPKPAAQSASVVDTGNGPNNNNSG